jgi:LmbE family N-acetylglucosaminyl deacetylase
MNNPPTILSFFAHPDDETFLAAGTMAYFQERGSKVVVCSATRGEEGEIQEGVPAERATLGEFREEELRNAMRAVGVDDVRFLGYRDSGMAGSETNEAPEAFVQVPVDEAGRAVADLFDDVQPDIVIAFSHEGIYLHPDHIASHNAVVTAIELAAADSTRFRPSAVLWASAPREWFLEVWNVEGNMFAEMPFETIQQMGLPMAELTHAVDVSGYREQIDAAFRAHASQFGGGDPFEWMPDHLSTEFVRYNFFQQASLPWNGKVELPAVFSPLP